MRIPLLRALLLLIPILSAACTTSSPRDVRSLNKGWRFIREDLVGAKEAKFDDSSWEKVSMPHTWNLRDGADGGNNYYRGPAWYRRVVKLSDSDLKRSVFLRFDGASTVAEVFVNGKRAGEHLGGFSAFCLEVTDLVHRGDNVVAVRVNNAKREDVTPLSGDFTIFGGLYRDVSLLVLERVSIMPMDDGGPGFYLAQQHVDEEAAQINARVELRNSRGSDENVIVAVTVRDAAGRVVVQRSGAKRVPARGDEQLVLTFGIGKPHLWNGLADPHLYTATAEVYDGGGKVLLDRVVQPLGLRTVAVDAEKGFLLNGKPYAIRGVNRHQERLGKGWAISAADVDEDYKLMREMGVTAVRGCHYQHSEYEHALCDRLGMIVWAELAMVNAITNSKEFDDNARQQLRELIKQNFNHPSIAFWSLYNELRFNDKRAPEDLRLVKELNDLAHALDGTRLTTAAIVVPADHPMNVITDVLSFNRYFGWYNGTPMDWGSELDKIRDTVPAAKAIGVSEYGAGASIKHHEVYPATRPATVGPWHPEEWQAIVHENAYGAMKEKSWLWGTFLWVMFDFASDGRKEGDHLGINDKGLVTGDRKTRKDAFYFYKANWTTEPFVHITSRRFSPRPAGPTPVKVYSNGGSVELFLNGKSLGRREGTNGVFVWDDVTLEAGKYQVRALGAECKDECTWIVESSSSTQSTQPSTTQSAEDPGRRWLRQAQPQGRSVPALRFFSAAHAG